MECIMEMRKVTAIVRGSMLEKVEARLEKLGVHGCSITKVKGSGEYADFYTRDHLTEHARIEIFTEMERAEEIARAIMDAAHVGQPGDGIVAILPVEKFYHIRTKSEVTAEPA